MTDHPADTTPPAEVRRLRRTLTADLTQWSLRSWEEPS